MGEINNRIYADRVTDTGEVRIYPHRYKDGLFRLQRRVGLLSNMKVNAVPIDTLGELIRRARTGRFYVRMSAAGKGQTPTQLRLQAITITDALIDPAATAEEWRVRYKLHKGHERCRRIIRTKKDEALAANNYRCEVCNFDPIVKYGDFGVRCLDCHHTVPVATLQPGQATTLDSLALVCGHCHRLLHNGREVLELEQLRDVLRAQGQLQEQPDH